MPVSDEKDAYRHDTGKFTLPLPEPIPERFAGLPV
jgi:hypothetical protein